MGALENQKIHIFQPSFAPSPAPTTLAPTPEPTAAPTLVPTPSPSYSPTPAPSYNIIQTALRAQLAASCEAALDPWGCMVDFCGKPVFKFGHTYQCRITDLEELPSELF